MAVGSGNYRFTLISDKLGSLLIPEPKNVRKGVRDVIEKDNDRRTFMFSKNQDIELHGNAYDYLLQASTFGIRQTVNLVEAVKDDMRTDERFTEVSNLGIDLGSMTFDPKRRTVKCQVKEGGLIDTIKARFDDDYDILLNEAITGDVVQPVNTFRLTLPQRRLFRRSRIFLPDNAEVTAEDDAGSTARALPFQVEFQSGTEISDVFNANISSVNDTYGNLTGLNGAFIQNVTQDTQYVLNGTIKITMLEAVTSVTLAFDLVVYEGGANGTFKEVLLNFGNLGPILPGQEIEHTFTDYEVNLKAGESLAINTLSDYGFGGPIRYKPEGSVTLVTENLFRVTSSNFITFREAFRAVAARITGRDDIVRMPDFEAGGRYEGLLYTRGIWLRNMPPILNEGEEDERRLQIDISLEELFDAINIIEPFAYETITEGDLEYLKIFRARDTQQSFVGLQLGETIDGTFNYYQIQDELRQVIPNNFYGSIRLGSRTSGSEYAEINNLYSTSGNTTWNTINVESDSEYEYITDFRTGAEDFEITRQLQHEDNPDLDSEYDDQNFMYDTKVVNGEYVVKLWGDFFSTPPTNVYSFESNFNWAFMGYFLLLGHGWKLNAALQKEPNEFIRFISSNCNSSVTYTPIGGAQRSEESNIQHTLLDRATFNPMAVTFELPLNNEIIFALRAKTNGVDNKYGVIRALTTEGLLEDFRLIKVDENNPGKWEAVEAKTL